MVENDAAVIQRHIRAGLKVMDAWVQEMENDPGKALAFLTHLGLGLAEECQKLSESVIDMVEGNAERRFHSLDGGLFRSNGSVVTLSADHFTILNAPTGEHTVEITGMTDA